MSLFDTSGLMTIESLSSYEAESWFHHRQPKIAELIVGYLFDFATVFFVCRLRFLVHQFELFAVFTPSTHSFTWGKPGYSNRLMNSLKSSSLCL
jgi:hypothetical protein